MGYAKAPSARCIERWDRKLPVAGASFSGAGLARRAENRPSLRVRARMPHRWEPTFRYSQIGNSFCSAEGGSEPNLPDAK
jgi:hypothetical protein